MKTSVHSNLISEHIPVLRNQIHNIKPDERIALNKLIQSKTSEVGGVAKVRTIYSLEIIAILGGQGLRFFKPIKK